MSVRKRWPVILLLAAAAVLLVWFAVAAVQARSSATALQAQIDVVEQHARAVDTAALSADLPVLRDRAHALQQDLSAPPWAIASRLPLVGGTADSARRLASAATAVADGTHSLDAVLPGLDPATLRTSAGVFDTDALAAAAAPLDELADRVAAAGADVSAADPGALGPVGPAVEQAQQAFVDAPQRLRSAARALRVTAHLLGGDGPRTSMVIMQNGSEARGTGGFVGAYSLVRTDQGRVDVSAFDTNNSLATPIPNAGMPRQFLRLWGKQDTAEWASFNLSRHFPYTGQLSRSGMAARGTRIDDVIALDAHVVAALLAGTGPISARGVTLDSANAEQFFNRDVYTRFPVVAEKDAVVVDLMGALVDRLTAQDLDLAAMVTALRQPVGDGRLLVWSHDGSDEADLQQLVVGGVVPATAGPWTAVALNNSAGNKLDAYVSSHVSYTAATCGTGPSTTELMVRNDAPTDLVGEADSRTYLPGTSPGTTRLLVDVYGPVGAHYRRATLDGKRQYVRQGTERGHPVWRYAITLAPGGSSTLSVQFKERPAPGLSPQVFAQPMAVPQTVTASRSC